MAKIICKDNFDRETSSDFLIATGVSEYNAARIVKLLNEAEFEGTSDYYQVVPDDYKLYKYEP